MSRWGAEISVARAKAHAKHGEQSIENEPVDSHRWLPILVEEIGEVARALTYDGKSNLREELLDVMAVASALVDAIDGQRMFDELAPGRSVVIPQHARLTDVCEYLADGYCYWCCALCDRHLHACGNCGMDVDHNGREADGVKHDGCV